MCIDNPNRVLIIVDSESPKHLGTKKCNLTGAIITVVSSIDELDTWSHQEKFDLIIVGSKILLEPTNSAMSDILMLSQLTTALVIANEPFDASGLVNSKPAQQLSSHKAENPHSTCSQMSLVAETIAGVDHASRNLIQIAHSRIDKVRRISNGSLEVKENLDWLSNSYHSIHEMFGVTRSICSPIELELEYVNIYKIMDECWREFQGDPRDEFHSNDYSGADRLTLIDEKKVRVAVTTILKFLLKTCGDKDSIQVEFGVPDQKTLASNIHFEFRSTRTEISKRPNAIVELAVAKRMIQLHGGEFEVSVADPLKTSCTISFPIRRESQLVG